jgi:protein-S-isoprenylcysteine O-methyltransferase Ste14
MIEKSRIIVSRIFAGFLFFLVCFSNSPWEAKAPMVASILLFLGAVLVGIASIGRLWCSVYIAGYKTGSLVTQGPYSMCRNPLYFFSLLGAIGVGLASETFLIPLLILIAFTAYYPFVIKSEEEEMIKIHKSNFETYLKNVPAFFPKISLLKEPAQYTVKPIIFRQHMFDTLFFIWLFGLLAVIQELHESKLIPLLFNIY